MKEEGQIYKPLPQNFKFLPGDLVMVFQSLVTILPPFPTLKDHNYVPRQKLKLLRQTFCSQGHVEQVCQISWR